MTLAELRERLTKAVLESPKNAICADYALRPELAGTPYYDAPLVGCTAAEEPLFVQFRNDPKIYGQDLRLPGEWLPGL